MAAVLAIVAGVVAVGFLVATLLALIFAVLDKLGRGMPYIGIDNGIGGIPPSKIWIQEVVQAVCLTVAGGLSIWIAIHWYEVGKAPIPTGRYDYRFVQLIEEPELFWLSTSAVAIGGIFCLIAGIVFAWNGYRERLSAQKEWSQIQAAMV